MELEQLVKNLKRIAVVTALTIPLYGCPSVERRGDEGQSWRDAEAQRRRDSYDTQRRWDNARYGGPGR